MPVDVDTFAIPYGQTQQQNTQEASTPGYYTRRDFEARQQVMLQENDTNHHLSDQEIEIDAMLSPEQRAQRLAEKEASIDLNNEEYNPDYFENINQAAREERLADEAHSYYSQQRESVAAPQAQEIVGVTYEASMELSAHPEQNMPRLSSVGKLIVSSREEVVLAA